MDNDLFLLNQKRRSLIQQLIQPCVIQQFAQALPGVYGDICGGDHFSIILRNSVVINEHPHRWRLSKVDLAKREKLSKEKLKIIQKKSKNQRLKAYTAITEAKNYQQKCEQIKFLYTENPMIDEYNSLGIILDKFISHLADLKTKCNKNLQIGKRRSNYTEH